MNQPSFLSIGFLFIVIGFIIIIAGSFLTSAKSTDSNTKVSVVGFIGPFPFGFGNDKNMLITLLIVGIIAISLFTLFSSKP